MRRCVLLRVAQRRNDERATRAGSARTLASTRDDRIVDIRSLFRKLEPPKWICSARFLDFGNKLIKVGFPEDEVE